MAQQHTADWPDYRVNNLLIVGDGLSKHRGSPGSRADDRWLTGDGPRYAGGFQEAENRIKDYDI